jgi:hypothetical protein
MAEPVSVLIKFGFLLVLFLFVLWVSLSALRDLRTTDEPWHAPPEEGTGMYAASVGLPDGHAGNGRHGGRLVVERGAGLRAGTVIDVGDGVLLGRSETADLRLEDPFASSHHARLVRQGRLLVLEDLGSTNGTYLNGEPLGGPQPLHTGDRVRIGDTELSYED